MLRVVRWCAAPITQKSMCERWQVDERNLFQSRLVLSTNGSIHQSPRLMMPFTPAPPRQPSIMVRILRRLQLLPPGTPVLAPARQNRRTPVRRTPVAVMCAAVLLFAAPTLLAQETRTVERTFAIDQGAAVSIENHRGAIEVRMWDRGEVEISARIEAGSDEMLEATNISMRKQGGNIAIETEYEDNGGSGLDRLLDLVTSSNSSTPAVYYRIQMPASSRLDIDDHESEISVRGLRNNAAVSTHEGSITLRDIAGAVNIDTHEGRVDVNGLRGPLQIDTHESDISIDNLEGPLEIDAHDPFLRAMNIQGDVQIDTHEGRFGIEDLRGAVQLDAHDPELAIAFAALTGNSAFETHEGRIQIELPAGTGFDLAADFDDDDAQFRADFDLENMLRSEGRYRGRVSGGGPQLKFEMHDGAVAIRYR